MVWFTIPACQQSLRTACLFLPHWPGIRTKFRVKRARLQAFYSVLAADYSRQHVRLASVPTPGVTSMAGQAQLNDTEFFFVLRKFVPRQNYLEWGGDVKVGICTVTGGHN